MQVFYSALRFNLKKLTFSVSNCTRTAISDGKTGAKTSTHEDRSIDAHSSIWKTISSQGTYYVYNNESLNDAGKINTPSARYWRSFVTAFHRYTIEYLQVLAIPCAFQSRPLPG